MVLRNPNRGYGFGNLSRLFAFVRQPAPRRRTSMAIATRLSAHLGSITFGHLPIGSTMQVSDGIVDAIGNTPLIRLKRASEATGCTILGKAEFMNPGQSVKDRAALFIIQDAVRRGTLRAGRRGRRRHRRQYRHRAGPGRQRAGLSHRDRHPGDAEPGEEGHAAPVRRRAGRGAGGPLLQSRTTT